MLRFQYLATLLVVTLPACALYPNPDPGEVQVSCELQPQEPTTEQPNPPQDPCAPWGPEAVHTDLLIHQRLWRESFPDTDEWAAEAPLLPSRIEVLNVGDLCEVLSCTEEQARRGAVGMTYVYVGVVYVAGLPFAESTPRTPPASSLAHELVHMALFGAYGYADKNHEEPGGPWGPEHEDYILKLQDTWGAVEK